MRINGRIIKQISNLYTVKCNDDLYGCSARGVFRKKKITPLVGDNVVIDTDNNVITEILPRKNELKRPVISNVDIALIVTSVKHPNLDLNLLDRLISIITFNDIKPVICFTKLDLLEEYEKDIIDNLRCYYEMIGINVVYNSEISKIKKILEGNIAVMAGQTGAGKSSLLNKLVDENIAKTGEISMALGRGRHTTRHTQIYEVAGGLLADTPGFSSLDLSVMDKKDLRDSFIEFQELTCQFRDCEHAHEKNCGVKEAVKNKKILESRYNNYLQFLRELGK